MNNDTLLKGALDPVDGAPPRFGIVGVDMTANFEDKTVAGHLVHTSAAKNNNVLAELEGTISGNHSVVQKMIQNCKAHSLVKMLMKWVVFISIREKVSVAHLVRDINGN